MPTYLYKAVDQKGKYAKGKITADTEAEVEQIVSQGGKTLISCQEATKNQQASRSRRVSIVKNSALITFTYQLGTYLDSGLPLMTALYDLANSPEDPNMGIVVLEIYKMIEKGFTLEDSLKVYPKIFNKLYVGTVRSGETTGNLAEVLKYLSGYLEWQDSIKGQVKQALMYPAILFTAISGAVVLLVTFVFPKFVAIFKGMNIDLPASTKMLIWLSDFMRLQWKVIIVNAILIGIGIKVYINTNQGRYLFDKMTLHLPIFGILIKKVGISKFAHTFSMALRAGIDVLRALSLCQDVVGNKVLEKDLALVRDKVNIGENLANSFRDTVEFPSLVVRMVSVGEASGTLENTIDKVSQYYDNDVPKTIAKVFTMLEPILLVIMGCGVGFIAFSIFVPMFSMVNVMKFH